MATFSERLRARRARLNMTQEQLAEAAKVSPSSITAWERGLNPPTGRMLEKLALALSTSGAWLLGGAHEQEASRMMESSPSFRVAPEFQNSVPVVSWAAAGHGGNYADLAEQIEERLLTDCKDPNAYALIIEGDSMEPEFRSGDRVIFQPNSQARNGDVCVARLNEDGQVYFKLVHFIGQHGEVVQLKSYNPLYTTLEFPRRAFRFIHPMYSMTRRRTR